MKISTICLLPLFALLAACGGGSGGGSGNNSGASAGSNAGATPTGVYQFIRPKQGQTQTYNDVVSDTAGKLVVSYSYTETVTQSNSDGSYFVTLSSPFGKNGTYTVANSIYEIQLVNFGFDSKQQYVMSLDSGVQYDPTCAYTSHQAGMPPQLVQYGIWDLSQMESCDTPATQTSSFIGMETVTVAAGTFPTYKFQTVRTVRDNISAAVYTFTTTTWINASPTDARVVKGSMVNTTSGVTGFGDYPEFNTWELASYN